MALLFESAESFLVDRGNDTYSEPVLVDFLSDHLFVEQVFPKIWQCIFQPVVVIK